ncbi:MAG: hypothetical protein ABSG33_04295 [Candidatus Bathyarchaeia archaeon]|jgi:L-lactate permease
MDNWKIVNKLSFLFGIVFIVFTGIAAVATYELDTVLYLSTAPAKLVYMSVLTASLPFIVAGVISFVVAIVTSNAINSESESLDAEVHARKEAETKAEQEAKAQAEQEIAFEETNEEKTES